MSEDFATQLKQYYGFELEEKLRDRLAFLARPVSDCRTLRSISVSQPQFRNIWIKLIKYEDKVSIPAELHTTLVGAIHQLRLDPRMGNVGWIVELYQEKFQRSCSEPYSLHAEMQLYMHLKKAPGSWRSLHYMGASKKACFLCWNFLQALEEKIETRGTHEVCYPAWGVPSVNNSQTEGALTRLAEILEARIRVFPPFAPATERAKHVEAERQSTFVSAISRNAEE
jgi:hypothetical protein